MRVSFLVRRWGSCVALALAVSACGGDEATPFPPGLDPLERATAPAPVATATDRYPEVLRTAAGETSAYEWVHGRAYVHASLDQVFAAMRDPDVATDRRRVSEYTVARNSEPQYPTSFRVHNVVHDIITLEFDIDWRLGLNETASPRVALGRYQKTNGTTFITLLAGSVQARQVEANVTELELVRHIKSSGSGAVDAEQYLRDYYANILARVRGQALPTFR